MGGGFASWGCLLVAEWRCTSGPNVDRSERSGPILTVSELRTRKRYRYVKREKGPMAPNGRKKAAYGLKTRHIITSLTLEMLYPPAIIHLGNIIAGLPHPAEVKV